MQFTRGKPQLVSARRPFLLGHQAPVGIHACMLLALSTALRSIVIGNRLGMRWDVGFPSVAPCRWRQVRYLRYLHRKLLDNLPRPDMMGRGSHRADRRCSANRAPLLQNRLPQHLATLTVAGRPFRWPRHRKGKPGPRLQPSGPRFGTGIWKQRSERERPSPVSTAASQALTSGRSSSALALRDRGGGYTVTQSVPAREDP
jgi:hypothetical protein